mmetsp:Transcript_18090/g.51433  ORF Transcript_18090/g.51433 Transcript_18090/m.51433 type:complete len:541 (+) Transcript_18090:912-2534(+)
MLLAVVGRLSGALVWGREGCGMEMHGGMGVGHVCGCVGVGEGDGPFLAAHWGRRESDAFEEGVQVHTTTTGSGPRLLLLLSLSAISLSLSHKRHAHHRRWGRRGHVHSPPEVQQAVSRDHDKRLDHVDDVRETDAPQQGRGCGGGWATGGVGGRWGEGLGFARQVDVQMGQGEVEGPQERHAALRVRPPHHVALSVEDVINPSIQHKAPLQPCIGRVARHSAPSPSPAQQERADGCRAPLAVDDCGGQGRWSRPQWGRESDVLGGHWVGVGHGQEGGAACVMQHGRVFGQRWGAAHDQTHHQVRRQIPADVIGRQRQIARENGWRHAKSSAYGVLQGIRVQLARQAQHRPTQHATHQPCKKIDSCRKEGKGFWLRGGGLQDGRRVAVEPHRQREPHAPQTRVDHSVHGECFEEPREGSARENRQQQGDQHADPQCHQCHGDRRLCVLGRSPICPSDEVVGRGEGRHIGRPHDAVLTATHEPAAATQRDACGEERVKGVELPALECAHGRRRGQQRRPSHSQRDEEPPPQLRHHPWECVDI